MSLPEIFINRPIATCLIALAIFIFGIISFNFMPISALPEVEYPIITVDASITGASPEIMASTVAAPLEKYLGKISGVTDISSTNAIGQTRIILQFALDQNLDTALKEVEGAVNVANNELPSNLIKSPVYRKVNPSDSPIMVMSLTSKIFDRIQLYNIATEVLEQKITMTPGVGQVIIAGSSDPAIRIEVNPQKLNAYNLSIVDVSNAIEASNSNNPKGRIIKQNLVYQINSNSQVIDPEEYADLIIKNDQTNFIRLKDLATITSSTLEQHNNAILNNQPAILLVVLKSRNSNVINTNKLMREKFYSLRDQIPAEIAMDIVLDRTSSIKESINEISKTMLLAMFFVVLIVYFFLQRINTILIPAVAMILSMLATFALMWLAGIGINIISLMALTISTGFAIDDAIVVLENITRYVEKGLNPKEAALRGTKEISFTIFSISISLIAVFIPILFMSGIIGRYFNEFALTLVMAILSSLFISLTVTPVMAAKIIKAQQNVPEKKLLLKKITEYYKISLKWSLANSRLLLTITILTLVANIFLFQNINKGFFPQLDTGRIIATLVSDEQNSFEYLNNKLINSVAIIKKDPAVEYVFGYIGSGSGNNASIYISLYDMKKRKISSQKVIDRLNEKLVVSAMAGTSIYMQVAQDIVLSGRQNKGVYQYNIQANTTDELNIYSKLIKNSLGKLPSIKNLSSSSIGNAHELYLKIDYDKAASFGINNQLIDQYLYLSFSDSPVSTIYRDNKQYYVVLRFAKEHSKYPKDIENLYIRSNNGSLVSLANFSSYSDKASDITIDHSGCLPANTLFFDSTKNITISTVIKLVNDKISLLNLPKNIQTNFLGFAQAYRESISNQPILIILSLISIYLVLGILYESLVHPLTIILSLPSAIFGALIGLLIYRTELNIIGFIGIILLIGIVKKNAIMMIDFTIELLKKDEDLDHKEAIYQAAVIRFKPILMTTMATFFAAVPMLMSNGVDAQMLHPLGVTIIFGLLVSQFVTMYVVPVIYLELESLSKKIFKKIKN